jgi:CRISPR-associated protein (TIGR03986 family)
MANDQHKDPGYEDRIAVAPYNFVPLPPRAITDSAPKGPGGPVVRRPLSHDRYWDKDELGEPVYSGQFECELTTDTLLYIRGVLSEDDARKGKDVKETPEPYAIAGRPGIPGSSLRGMFRELVEIASFSKMSEVTSQKQVYRAVDVSSLGIKYRGRIMEEIERNVFVPRIKAGYIRRHENQWFIQPAEEIGGTTWCRIGERYIPSGLGAWPPQEVQEAQHVDGDPKVYNARTIYIQPGPYQFQEVKGGFLKIKYSRAQRASANPGEGLRPAALAISGKMTSKRSEAIILQPDPKRAAPDEWLPLRYKDEELEVMLDRAYEDQVTDQQAVILGNPQLEHGKQDRRGALRDLQPVFYLIENGKLVFFGHTLMMRLPYLHSPLDLVPAELRREEERDLAQAIFGYADKPVKDHASFAGRVFFSDAMLVGDPASAYAARDPIKPKVLSTPKPTTFQHYLTQSEPDNPASLSDYDDATTIRGHKLY